MFHSMYEEMTRFASEGDFKEELPRARTEFVARTGDLFESDTSYERRIGAFLEWYVLDRTVSFSPQNTPAKLYIEHVTPKLTTPELAKLRALTRTRLSLYEFRRAKEDQLVVVDLLNDEKVKIFERRKPIGLESGDLMEARVVPYEEHSLFSDALTIHQREGRKSILKVARGFRKMPRSSNEQRIDLVHQVAYYANRCERYKHVDPKTIFAEMEAVAAGTRALAS